MSENDGYVWGKIKLKDIPAFVGSLHDQVEMLQAKLASQAVEIERLREIARTNLSVTKLARESGARSMIECINENEAKEEIAERLPYLGVEAWITEWKQREGGDGK